MSTLIKRHNNDDKRSLFEGFDFLSIFDEQFSIDDFDKSVQNGKKDSDTVLSKARLAVKNAFNGTGEEAYHYEVIMSEEMKQAIESGEVSLIKGENGLIYAQLRGEKGRFGKPLPIVKQLEEQGISAADLQLAIQLDAISDQLETMISHLKSIEGSVKEVFHGQHNDRIGLFYSGLSLYAEAQCISDGLLRTQIQSHALKALSDANAQVIQEIRVCIEYLATEQYKGCKNAIDEIDKRLSSINKCYDVVYRSTFLKAAIYHEKGEIAAMLTAIDEYGRFIEKLIIPYTGLLSELDSNVQIIEEGTWSTIAKTLSICSEMRKQLSAQEELLLTMKGDYYVKG